MTLDYKDKCLVCLKTGGNLNIFTTYNSSDKKEELYVDVIKNCFNIEITEDSGIHEMCNECTLKLRRAYKFKHCIVDAVNKPVLAKVSESEKPCSNAPNVEKNSCDDKHVDVEADKLCGLEKTGDSEDYCIFDLQNCEVKDDNKNLQVDSIVESEKADLINLDEPAHIPFVIEKETNNDNHVTYFMDINNDILQVNIPLSNDDDVMKRNIEKDDVLSGPAEPYSLSILNENDLNTFLMEESDMKVLNIGGNGYKDIPKDDNAAKPETALNSDLGYISFEFNHDIDKDACFVNVADVIVKDKDGVSKSKRKAIRKVVKKNDKNADIENPVNDLENIKENKANVSSATDKKDGQKKPKKAVKRKGKSKSEEGTQISAFKFDENNTANIDVNDFPAKEVKGKKGKKTVRKNAKKDTETVKENVPDKDATPKKKKRREPKGTDDLINRFPVMPGQTKCEVCSEEFETTLLLSNHMTTHPPDYSCDICGIKFERKPKYTIHMRSHSTGPFFCKFCNQEFSNVNTRNTHEWRVHSKPEPFKCSHCGERFKTFLKRLRHLQNVHQESTKYPCDFCDKCFAYAAYKTKHIRIMHLNEREYKCEKCPAAFARKGALDNHLACKHGIGEMKYQCQFCSRKFFVQTALRWHVSATHNRFPCSECGEKFDNSTALELHSKTHSRSSLDISLGLDLSSLPLGELDDYGIMDDYLGLGPLEV